ncbi:lysozyme inhibitor LprI family protein [Chamaesiphon polymorphus]|nr:lysozyme inhibitor LprI family protein [Chamaesiphon polymorphus]
MEIGINPSTIRAESLVPPSNCVDTGQLALNRCAIARSKHVDELKSDVYQKLERQLYPRDRAQLASIEKTWLHFRTAHCQEVIEPFGNSSMVPLLYHNCLSSVTLDRIADLQHLTTASISKKLVEIESNNSIDRVHWHRYRSQHCKFEAAHFTKNTQRFALCEQRLTKTRRRQLQEMMSVR